MRDLERPKKNKRAHREGKTPSSWCAARGILVMSPFLRCESLFFLFGSNERGAAPTFGPALAYRPTIRRSRAAIVPLAAVDIEAAARMTDERRRIRVPLTDIRRLSHPNATLHVEHVLQSTDRLRRQLFTAS